VLFFVFAKFFILLFPEVVCDPIHCTWCLLPLRSSREEFRLLTIVLDVNLLFETTNKTIAKDTGVSRMRQSVRLSWWKQFVGRVDMLLQFSYGQKSQQRSRTSDERAFGFFVSKNLVRPALAREGIWRGNWPQAQGITSFG
jgi:hypothetical protein